MRSWRAFRPVPVGTAPSGGTCRARVLGLDPGSRHTGFGIIDVDGPATAYVACGAISTTAVELAVRLQEIFERVRTLVLEYRPDEIAIERVFVSRNADSALKLGQARGAALCGAFASMARVYEYSPREVKLAVVGVGGADKAQVGQMVRALLKVETRMSADAADALAVALCHAHGRALRQLLASR